MGTITRFQSRTEAGKLLAGQLMQYANRPDVIILGIPRNGMLVAAEVAKALAAPLDLCLVHDLVVPGHKNLTMGTIGSDGACVLNYEVLAWYGISSKTIDQVAAKELRELQRCDRSYRGNHSPPMIRSKVVILVDDGISTGATMRAAIAVLQSEQPRRLVIAVPVAPLAACNQFKDEVDEIVCLSHPDPFYSVELSYDNFAPAADETVHELLIHQSNATHLKTDFGIQSSLL